MKQFLVFSTLLIGLTVLGKAQEAPRPVANPMTGEQFNAIISELQAQRNQAQDMAAQKGASVAVLRHEVEQLRGLAKRQEASTPPAPTPSAVPSVP